MAPSAAGNRSARTYSVPMALASPSSRFLRWSKRLMAIENVNPMIRPSSVNIAPCTTRKSSTTSLSSGRHRRRGPAPNLVDRVSSNAATANTSKG